MIVSFLEGTIASAVPRSLRKVLTGGEPTLCGRIAVLRFVSDLQEHARTITDLVSYKCVSAVHSAGVVETSDEIHDLQRRARLAREVLITATEIEFW
jgi:hypothetical protein